MLPLCWQRAGRVPALHAELPCKIEKRQRLRGTLTTDPGSGPGLPEGLGFEFSEAPGVTEVFRMSDETRGRLQPAKMYLKWSFMDGLLQGATEKNSGGAWALAETFIPVVRDAEV